MIVEKEKIKHEKRKMELHYSLSVCSWYCIWGLGICLNMC